MPVAASRDLGDVLDRDQSAVANDPDSITHSLDLGELLRGEQHCAPALTLSTDEGEESLLHQWVEAARGRPAARVIGDVTRQVPEPGVDRERVAPAVEPEDARAAAGRMLSAIRGFPQSRTESYRWRLTEAMRGSRRHPVNESEVSE